MRMTREQQLQRMHNLAKGFHFYAYDSNAAPENPDLKGRKKWHL